MRPFNSQDGSGLKQSDENSTFVSLRRDFLGRTFCATKADLRWLQTVDFSFKSPPTYVKLLETLSQLPAYLMCEENSRLVSARQG